MLNIGVLVSGGGTNLQALMDYMDHQQVNARIKTVVSNKPTAYALERAALKGISTQVISPKDYKDHERFNEALLQHFVKESVDLVVMAGYLVVVGNPFVSTFRNRIINIHPSLIPAFCGNGYYGLKVHQAVLDKGVKITGATVHFVDEGTDTGPIIMQKAVAVQGDDTAKSLQQRVMKEAEWELLPKVVEYIAKGQVACSKGIVTIIESEDNGGQ